ncbi:beta-glucosidase [Streptacidiphilus sp. P02-A3a]|uniref:beta-glucosidase family protein n=1 Tax=Streptacidiphilus sp. P02-A3a TaxID=2704468 RepID=UPI0015FBC103|nr:glycoside hydrolase family 3 C-terminal domain-containing protein [Streptacidiphilus sp. P02-A3a]QMU68211.1 beta-glucosidase [Streptacidiphilus sp. P02-A3a]
MDSTTTEPSSTAAGTTTAGTAADRGREAAVEAALGRLDLTAKVALLAGADMWSLPANAEIGLGRLVMSDGPAGVRGEQWTPDDPSIAIPAPTALAATWDPDLVRRTGGLLAQEARRKGVHVVLAPTVNLHRSPRGGRHFEAYSEDPLLTGEIGAALVAGIQAGGVATTPKHWVANDSETDRYTVDVRADERTLRELYLAPFEAIVRKARPWGLMAAYNRVGGHSMSEHAELNNGVLRAEWGFDGVLVSDWTGARDTVRAALGGLDIAMPGPVTVYGEHLVAAVRDGRVPEAAVDELARRVLRLAARVGLLAGAPAAVPEPPADVDGEALAREVAARSFTLVRNQGALPLDPAPGSVAVIGAAAAQPRIGGGGSAQVFPTGVVSPLAGLRAALPPSTALGYALGADPAVHLAPLAAPVEAVLLGSGGAELGTAGLPDGGVRWIGRLPGGVGFADLRAVRITGVLQPQTTGVHRLGIRGQGRFLLEAGGRTLFDGEVRYQGTDPAGAFLNPPEEVLELDLDSTAPIELTLTHSLSKAPEFAGFGMVSFALGHGAPVGTEDELIDEAVALAASADVAVVVVATTEEVESEGVDRAGLALPGRQDELVRRVAQVNPRTVVVVNAGAPVLMPWREQVAAVLLTWFPGQEAGAALGEVLLGIREPGGRLPTTWPAAEADCPVWRVEPVDGRLDYREGLFVGYPAWQRRGGAAPAYWFGHGLGYTDWEYQGLDVRLRRPGPGEDPYAARAEAVVLVRNTGARTGRETVQVYLAPGGADPDRPDRRLAGFAVVEAAPGEVAEVRVELPLRAFQTWGADGWTTRPGRYTVEAGRSVADPRATAVLELPDGG